mgnify:CR=1 FL=1|jgi:2-polyprenyl-3-methyl-5-hydroxy-6-metoxy-1,4-benzoquinol methylase|tara:strand:- start:228 stop:935 length:708 start_codon:yes stop_codon:yes gene_type:complete
MNIDKKIVKNPTVADPIKTFWHNITKTEPYWSVLTNERWKVDNINPSEFYRTGDQTVASIFSKYHLEDIDTCLDFGCGVGRITAALAGKANHVDALDISTGMIKIAKSYMEDQNITNVTLVDTSKDTDFLSNQKGKYDLVFSSLVLQHNPLPRAKRLLGQLCLSISKTGFAVIHIHRHLQSSTHPSVSHSMQMHQMPLDEAKKTIKQSGCRLIRHDDALPTNGNIGCLLYIGREQ